MGGETALSLVLCGCCWSWLRYVVVQTGWLALRSHDICRRLIQVDPGGGGPSGEGGPSGPEGGAVSEVLSQHAPHRVWRL